MRTSSAQIPDGSVRPARVASSAGGRRQWILQRSSSREAVVIQQPLGLSGTESLGDRLGERGSAGSPRNGALAAAGAAVADAAAAYERTVARPRYNGTSAAPLEYLSPEEAPV